MSLNNIASIVKDALRTVSAIAGCDVRYSRGASWVKVRALPGHTDFSLSDENGAVSEYRSRDYVIEACNLVLDGSAIKPQRGDTITDGSSVYEVSRPDGSGQPWQFSDTAGTHYRIHTKLKAAT